MILFYFTTENLAKQNSCTQILLFWYVNRIVEPKAWVSSFSYQWITLFQIFGFSLLLLAHLAHLTDLTVHPHGQLSFSQTEDDDDAHQDCDQQRQHDCPPWWWCLVIFQAFLRNSFIWNSGFVTSSLNALTAPLKTTEDTAWFPFICLLATVYFRPLSIFPTFSAVCSIRTFRSYFYAFEAVVNK